MSLIDRAIPTATAAVLHYDGSYVRNYLAGSTTVVTGTSYQIDPVVSGTIASCYVSGAGNYVTVSTHELASSIDSSIELFLWFPQTAGTLATLNGQAWIAYNASGYLTFTLRHGTAGSPTVTTVNIDYQPVESTQIVVNYIGTRYEIYINAVLMASGDVGLMPFGSGVVVGNGPAVVFGAAFVYKRALAEKEVVNHAVEAFAGNMDDILMVDGDAYIVSDQSQNYSMRLDVPAFENWSFYESNGVAVSSTGAIALNTAVIERYDAVTNSWVISQPELITLGTGQATAYFTHVTNRDGGVVTLRPRHDGLDTHSLKIESNVIKYRFKQFSVDGSGVYNGVVSSTTVGSAVSGNVSIGFAWSDGNLYLVQNGNALVTLRTAYGFSESDYEIVFGNDETGLSNYHADKAAWNWQIRLRPDNVIGLGATDYGAHSFDTAAQAVLAEGVISVSFPVNSTDTIRKPYLDVDGYLYATPVETVGAIAP